MADTQCLNFMPFKHRSLEMETKLTILLYGNFRLDWLLACSYRRAFERLGHKVIPFEGQQVYEFLPSWLCNRIGHRLTIRSLSLRSLGAKRWNSYFLETVRKLKPDLVFVLNGSFLMPETLGKVRADGAAVFIFHADNPFPPYPNHRAELLPCGLECDCYFIWSRLLVKRLKQMGVRRVEYLPFAWDSEIFPYQPFPTTPEYDYDTVFIGNWSRERETWLTPLSKHYKLVIWGPDYWGKRTRAASPLRNCWQGKTLTGIEAAKVLRKSRITLHVLNAHNLPDGVNMRSFELPGCGVFSLSTRTEGALEIFPEGQAAAYFSTHDELREQIEYFLHNDKKRQDMIEQAHAIVAGEHTYLHRVQKIISVYEQDFS
jgi:glycosyltransferase involved in cell wall biosynthesis